MQNLISLPSICLSVFAELFIIINLIAQGCVKTGAVTDILSNCLLQEQILLVELGIFGDECVNLSDIRHTFIHKQEALK